MFELNVEIITQNSWMVKKEERKKYEKQAFKPFVWCKYYFSYLTLFMTFHFALCHECPLLSSG